VRISRLFNMAGGICAFGLLAACSDITEPVLPDSVPPRVERNHHVGSVRVSPEATAYICNTSLGTPGGVNRYRYGRFYLSFPPGLTGKEKGSTTFQYRLLHADGEIAGAADCTVPATPQALEMVREFFRLPADGTGGVLQGGTCIYNVEGKIECEPVSGTAIMPEGGKCDPTIHFGCKEDTGSGGSNFWNPPTEPWGEETGGGDDPNPPPDPCTTGAPTIDSPAVQKGFEDLWNRSNYGPDVPMSQRREQGGWLIQNADGSFHIQPFPTSWRSTPCMIDMPNPLPVPPGAIAMVHTHPYRNGERLTACDLQETPWGFSAPITYRNDPSTDDEQVLRDLRVNSPQFGGIIIDADKIVAYTGGEGAPGTEARFDRCGY